MLYCQLESWLECQKAIEAARRLVLECFTGHCLELAVIGRAVVRCTLSSMQSHGCGKRAS